VKSVNTCAITSQRTCDMTAISFEDGDQKDEEPAMYPADRLACWKDPMTEKSRGRVLNVIPRKVAKRACAVPFPTNLSALTNRSATPCVVGEIHLRRSSSLKTNARPNDWAPRGPPPFHVGGHDGYGILDPFVAHDARSFLAGHADSLPRLHHRVSLADDACRWMPFLSSKSPF